MSNFLPGGEDFTTTPQEKLTAFLEQLNTDTLLRAVDKRQEDKTNPRYRNSQMEYHTVHVAAMEGDDKTTRVEFERQWPWDSEKGQYSSDHVDEVRISWSKKDADRAAGKPQQTSGPLVLPGTSEKTIKLSGKDEAELTEDEVTDIKQILQAVVILLTPQKPTPQTQ